MDEAAKTRWQRAKPVGKVIGLPGYLVAGEWIGVSPTISLYHSKEMDRGNHALRVVERS